MASTKGRVLTVDRLRELLRYDAEAGQFFWRAAGRCRRPDLLAGAVTGGYIQICIDHKIYKSHRLAWLYVFGAWPSGQIDHVNRIPSDNRISNLRVVTDKENKQNQTRPRGLTVSGFRGVSWCKQNKKWCARIHLNKQKHHLGLFTDKHEAHHAYLKAKSRLHPFCFQPGESA